jgi:hypothetical protein
MNRSGQENGIRKVMGGPTREMMVMICESSLK